jgi:hypothetical protein
MGETFRKAQLFLKVKEHTTGSSSGMQKADIESRHQAADFHHIGFEVFCHRSGRVDDLFFFPRELAMPIKSSAVLFF